MDVPRLQPRRIGADGDDVLHALLERIADGLSQSMAQRLTLLWPQPPLRTKPGLRRRDRFWRFHAHDGAILKLCQPRQGYLCAGAIDFGSGVRPEPSREPGLDLPWRWILQKN